MGGVSRSRPDPGAKGAERSRGFRFRHEASLPRACQWRCRWKATAATLVVATDALKTSPLARSAARRHSPPPNKGSWHRVKLRGLTLVDAAFGADDGCGDRSARSGQIREVRSFWVRTAPRRGQVAMKPRTATQ